MRVRVCVCVCGPDKLWWQVVEIQGGHGPWRLMPLNSTGLPAAGVCVRGRERETKRCECACVCASVHVRACACVRVCGVCTCARVCASMRCACACKTLYACMTDSSLTLVPL